MSHSAVIPVTEPVAVPTVPMRELAPWVLFLGLLAVLALFFATTDQGAVVHEWVHDGSHLLGYPCH
ncbi:CbtB-domain containing protein [Kineosporiaceae bacterium SCSIO 59966]|nr:CbtB-domain containing protein [Kineosporiaceae bacterium SCSIO 59966]